MGQSRQSGALAVTCLFPIIAAIFVGARVLSRYMGRNFGWDDWLIMLALLLLLGQAISIYEYIILSHTGFRASSVPPQTIEERVLAAKWSFGVQMFYHPMMGAARASIIMFLFRVKDQRRRIRYALHFAFWMNIGYTISTSIVNVFQCTPIKYAYLRPKMDQVGANGKVVPGGKCIDTLAFIMASCGLSIFMDIIIIPIPTAMVWGLQMPRRTKIAISLVMSMGWIATLASVVRLIVYYRRFTVVDRTYNIGLVTSIVEPSVCIIAACAPPLRRLFSFILPSYFSEEHTSYTTHRTPQNNRSHNRGYDFGYIEEESRIDRDHHHHHHDDHDPRERTAPPRGDDQIYGMKPLGSIDSRENIVGVKRVTEADIEAADAEPKSRGYRSQSVKTGISEPPSEVHEAVPKHVLNKY